MPHAKILHGDALEIIQRTSSNVLIGNLPHAVTQSLRAGAWIAGAYTSDFLSGGDHAGLLVRGPSAPKSQYGAPLLTREFAVDALAGAR